MSSSSAATTEPTSMTSKDARRKKRLSTSRITGSSSTMSTRSAGVAGGVSENLAVTVDAAYHNAAGPCRRPPVKQASGWLRVGARLDLSAVRHDGGVEPAAVRAGIDQRTGLRE